MAYPSANEARLAAARFHAFVDRQISAALKQPPSKADLQTMLENAAANTAAQKQSKEGAGK